MSIENGVLLGLDGQAIYWHTPSGRSAVHLPDSRDLWDVIWENRDVISGFAHSHPGSGLSLGPSYEDITTFSAIELALGRRLIWPIINRTNIVFCEFVGEHKYDYMVDHVDYDKLHEIDKFWIDHLWMISYESIIKGDNDGSAT